jgi:acetyl esterase/lipase
LPELDLSRRIVYPVERAPNTIVRRQLVYKRDGAAELVMDVYAPPAPVRRGGSPALFFVHGGPIPREMMPAREWGCFVSYGELAAASGLVGVVFNHRLHAWGDYQIAQSDMQAAIDYVRGHADDLAVDPDALGVWVFSGGGPLASWCLRERPAYLRCLLAFYALLDVRHTLPPDADPELVTRAQAFSAAAHLRERSPGLPLFIARAGLDAPFINDAIDLFVREALAANAPLDLANHQSGHHAFDILDDDERSRDIIARAMTFAKMHLSHA